MKLKQVNWGIIGCGNVTEVKSGPAFNKTEGSRLVAVMRRDPAAAADYARRHNVPKWYDNADALISDPEVNALYIATPPDSHLEYTRKALRAGKPVYVEKPMARTAAECHEMNRISRETGVPLFTAYYRRALPYFVKLRELLQNGAIGDIRHIHLKLHWPPYAEETGPDARPGWRVIPEISGGGHFHDLAAHQFDYLEYVFGPVKYAAGYALNQAGLYNADDVVTAAFLFESGITGSGSWCFTVAPEQRADLAEVTGSKGTITFHFFEKDVIRVVVAGQEEILRLPYPAHVQQPLIELIVKELREGTPCAPSTGFTGAKASVIMDWITRK